MYSIGYILDLMHGRSRMTTGRVVCLRYMRAVAYLSCDCCCRATRGSARGGFGCLSWSFGDVVVHRLSL